MQSLMRPLFLIVFVLLVPILPFLLLGEPFESWTDHWQSIPPSRPVLAVLVIGLLATDILLPVPSSVVNVMSRGISEKDATRDDRFQFAWVAVLGNWPRGVKSVMLGQI